MGSVPVLTTIGSMLIRTNASNAKILLTTARFARPTEIVLHYVQPVRMVFTSRFQTTPVFSAIPSSTTVSLAQTNSAVTVKRDTSLGKGNVILVLI
jgi:hypothetical protein